MNIYEHPFVDLDLNFNVNTLFVVMFKVNQSQLLIANCQINKYTLQQQDYTKEVDSTNIDLYLKLSYI